MQIDLSATYGTDLTVNAAGGTIDSNGLNAEWAGAITGSGALTKTGDGTLTLTGANSYTGGTTISGGTLVGDTTSLQGDIANNATLQFAQATDGSYAGAVSGTGALVKTGNGVLTLTGANSYTGGTTISGGTLVGDTTSLQGDIANNATLQFAQATNGTYAGAVSGTGGLVKSGSGVLTLTGANSYTGGTTISGGTLVGNTASLQGDIANNATLQFAQATDGTYAGAVSGTGALVKTGNGVLTLTGANSYTGGTTISGGTLVGDTTSLQGDIANNATLQFAQATDGTYAGAVSGTGALVKTGNGVLTLTGANSYTGGTTISGGTLVGDTTSLQGDIANNATLQFAQATNGTYAGAVSGTGGLVKSGSGVLTLTGANSYTGGTTISGGTLVGDTTSLQGDIANNATLQFAQGSDGTYAGNVSGTGALVKTGSGVLTLTGANSYTGGTTISGGTLVGDTTSLQGNVANNATLQFAQTTDGTYAGAVSGSGALVKSGNGTLTLTGANSYTGGTTISGGTLVGDTTSLQGNVANNATLQFAQTTDGTYAGAVSGSGALVKSGSGVLTLTGANSYTGGTTISGGTLVGDTTSLQGDIANNATLQFAQGSDGTYAGNVSGTGALVKTGSGVLTLTGANSYTGGTTISGGTLVGDTTSLQGNVANNATLQFAQTTDGTYAGAVSGSGALVKSGNGTLTLTGANSYTGGTTISGGTLVGDTTSLQGNVANNATLQFAQTTDGTYAGAVSGSGALVKSGNGTLALTGANSYTGGTTISGGTLVGDTASLQGDVANNATLQFAQATNGVYTGSISGSGALVKTGAGKLNLTGASSYTGGTIVEQGTLAANGTLASNVDVLADARLMGAGSIGGMIVRTAATLAPGNSIDTLTVNGDALFEVGSTYEVEVNAAGDSDLLNVTGTTTIEGGTIAVLAADGNYAPRTSYTIINAGAIDGTFDDTTSNFAFLTPTLGYTPTSVSVTLTRNDVAFAGVAATANQRASATAIDAAFGSGTTLYDALIGETVAGARQVFDNLSGEVHASAMRATLQDSERFRRSLLNRMDTAEGTGQRLWLQFAVAKDDVDTDYNAAGFKRETNSFFGGGEFVAGNFLLGIAGGYTDGDLKMADRASRADIDGKHFAAYASGNAGPVAISAGVTYGDFDVDSTRDIAAGAISQQAEASYSARTIEAFGEAGMTFREGRSAITPFVGLSQLWLKRDGFAETGAGLGVGADTQKDDWAAFTAGTRASVPLNASESVKLNLAARWQHQINGTDVDTELAYVAGGPAFTVSGAPIAKDAGLVDAGLSWSVGGLGLSLDYSGTWTGVSQSHAGKATIGFRF